MVRKKKEIVEDTIPAVEETKPAVEEIITEEVLYEKYRAYPVEYKRTREKVSVLLDMRFIQACHDYGRSLAFDGYDGDCAAPLAVEFIEKLVFPVSGKKQSFKKDKVAISFGLGFSNQGFEYPERDLTVEDVDYLTQHITTHLEMQRIL